MPDTLNLSEICSRGNINEFHKGICTKMSRKDRLQYKHGKTWKTEKSDLTAEDLIKQSPQKFTEIQTLDGRLVYIPEGINPDAIFGKMGPAGQPYSEYRANVICQKIASGETITTIGKQVGMPSAWLIRLWRRDHPEFQELYDLAIKDRADNHRDKVLELARQATPETAQADRLKVDTFKWSAAVDQPEKYGKRNSGGKTPESQTAELVVATEEKD